MTDQCFTYDLNSNQVLKIPSKFGVLPCPSGLGCCSRGSICLSNGFCQRRNDTAIAKSDSLYSLGGCSDPSYPSQQCPVACSNFKKKEVVYQQDQKAWVCCGIDASNNAMCDRPTQHRFFAPAPDRLMALGVALPNNTADESDPTSSSTSQQANASGHSNGKVMMMPTAYAQPSGYSYHLSPGAVAGIAAAVSLSSMIMVATAAFLILRHRRGSCSKKIRGRLMQQDAIECNSKSPPTMVSYPPDFEVKSMRSTWVQHHPADSISNQQYEHQAEKTFNHRYEHQIENVSSQRHEIGGPNDQRHEADSTNIGQRNRDKKAANEYTRYELESPT